MIYPSRYRPHTSTGARSYTIGEISLNTFTVTTFIKRPQQEVFEFTTNPANASQWQSGTKFAQWSSEGPVGVGSVYQSVRKLLGREMKIDAEITHWDSPNLWGARIQNGSLKVEITNQFETQDGGTQMIQTFQGGAGGLFSIAERLAVKQLQKQVEADGQALKTLLESK